jgi:hypothetical protein
MGTFKKLLSSLLKRKRFYPIYCAHKGTSKKIIFRSSLIIQHQNITWDCEDSHEKKHSGIYFYDVHHCYAFTDLCNC